MEQTLSYYQRHKEHLKQLAREYHYKHREAYNAYSKEYYATHKDQLNAKRRAKVAKKKGEGLTRQRAHLDKPNTTQELETRRKTFEEIRLTPMEQAPPPVVWCPKPEDFCVRFD